MNVLARLISATVSIKLIIWGTYMLISFSLAWSLKTSISLNKGSTENSLIAMTTTQMGYHSIQTMSRAKWEKSEFLQPVLTSFTIRVLPMVLFHLKVLPSNIHQVVLPDYWKLSNILHSQLHWNSGKEQSSLLETWDFIINARGQIGIQLGQRRHCQPGISSYRCTTPTLLC